MPPPISAGKAPVVAPILASIESDPCFSVMLAFDRPIPELPFDINFVENSDKLCKGHHRRRSAKIGHSEKF